MVRSCYSDNTADLVDMGKNPSLGHMALRDDGADLVAPGIAFTPRERIERPQPRAPSLCLVDWDTPLLTQIYRLSDQKKLGLKFCQEALHNLRALPPSTRTGTAQLLLGQHTFGPGNDRCGTIGKRDVSDLGEFGDANMFCAYLDHNIQVGAGYKFSCAVPTTDGETYLHVERISRSPTRELLLRESTQQALASWYYLIHFKS